MDRRAAIRNLALVIGGAALLPACTLDMPTAHYKNFDINLGQQQLIEIITETIIPRTTTPGATDLGLDKFVILMLDDCTKKKAQQAFFTGMGEFYDIAQKMHGKSFYECDKKEREDVLNTFGHPNTYSKELKGFFTTIKGLTVFGYTQSKYFMTKQVVYELVPGRYNAYFPVKNTKTEVKHG